MIDFRLTEEQQALREMLHDFAEQEIRPRAAEHDRTGEFPWEIVKKGHELGLKGSTIPEAYGGPGLSYVDQCLAQEELAWGCAGINACLQVTNLYAEPILVAGTEEQKKAFLTPLTREPHLGAYCVTEPEAGSDVAGLRTTARKVGDEYVIDGTKQWITGAGFAAFYIVFASTDREKRHKGISAFVVPRDTPGLSVGKKEDMMGQRASDTRQVVFEDVKVPARNRLGAEGEAFGIAMAAFDRSRPCIAASSVGVARAAMEHALRYAQERRAFGVPIAQHGMIQQMLADMGMGVEAGRLLTWKAAHLADTGQKGSKVASMAKAFCADHAMRCTTDAVQIYGGYGFSKEYPVEKLMRDAKVMQIYEGTSQIQRLIVARRLVEEHPID